MNKKKILLLISNDLGLRVFSLLRKNKKLSISCYTSKKIKGKKFKFTPNKKSFENNLIKEGKFDFIILVYWPFIVNKKLFKKFNNSINFHPPYLPYGRGWYPHVHAILNRNIKYGVSLHQINHNIDSGKIWLKKRIFLKGFVDSTNLYLKAQKEIYSLFKSNYMKIINSKIRPKIQRKVHHFFSKKTVNKYDEIYLNKKYRLRDLINLIKSRNFYNKSYIYFRENKKKHFIKIEIFDGK